VKRAAAFVAMLALAGCAHRYDAKGVVLRVEPGTRQVTISHEAIGTFMEPMVMPFTVADDVSLTDVGAGDRVAFRLTVRRGQSRIEALRVVSAARVDAGLAMSPARSVLLPIGGTAPDFELIDQQGRRVTLAQLRGQVVAVTFIYTRCPLPDYCPRMTANFRALAARFRERLGRDLTLLTITFDPKYDSSEVLRRYARDRGADQSGWLFLTGSVPEITKVCDAFGVEFWPEEGLISHSLQSAVLDRDGKLAGTIEGKEYDSRQLGDLVASVLDR
jgi:protein SCO1